MRYAISKLFGGGEVKEEIIAPLSNRDKNAKLRRHGFRIHSRPNRGPVTWIRRGEVYTEREALIICGVNA